MTTIQIAYEVPAATVANIEALLEETALYNFNCGGAVFKIERADYTCITDDDSIDAVSLFYEIQNIISSE